jgi:hypothetical protein
MKTKILLFLAVIGLGQGVKGQNNIFPVTGNVGIGTNNPLTQLHLINGGNAGGAGGEIGFSANDAAYPIALIKSSLNFNSNNRDAGDLFFYTREMLSDPNRAADDLSLRMSIKHNGKIGIGTSDPKYQLHLISGGNVGGAGGEIGFSANDGTFPMALIKSSLIFTSDNRDAGDLCFYTREKLMSPSRSADDLSLRLTIKNEGNVGIGTATPDAPLTVNGRIHAKEIVVDNNILADYVFAPTYNLRPLAEVEQFVKANSHLPEIPSAKEAAQNGVNIGYMQNKLLQKVEELTLYVIELKKENEQMKKENSQLNNRVGELEKK